MSKVGEVYFERRCLSGVAYDFYRLGSLIIHAFRGGRSCTIRYNVMLFSFSLVPPPTSTLWHNIQKDLHFMLHLHSLYTLYNIINQLLVTLNFAFSLLCSFRANPVETRMLHITSRLVGSLEQIYLLQWSGVDRGTNFCQIRKPRRAPFNCCLLISTLYAPHSTNRLSPYSQSPYS